MRWLGGIAVLLLLAACSPQPATQTAGADITRVPAVRSSAHLPGSAGIWSTSGLLLRDQPVSSPDGRFTLQWDNGHIAVSGAAHGEFADRTMGDTPPEILWSPSGVYVAITWSDDTAVPVWSVDAYYLGSGTVHAVDAARSFRRGDPYPPNSYWGTPESNVGAIAWLDNETSLLLALEQPLNGSWMNGSMLSGVKFALPDAATSERFDSDDLLAWREHLGPRVRRDLERQQTSTPP